MIGKKISYHTIFEDVGGGEMRVAYKAEDTQLRCFSWFKPSPKGIDIPTEGNLPANPNGGRPRFLPAQYLTTLNGLNTRGACAAITCQGVDPHCLLNKNPAPISCR